VKSYLVTLNIIDDHKATGTVSNSITTIANTAPTVSFEIVSILGYTVSVESTASDTDGTLETYEWDWGDNTAKGTTPSLSHIYLAGNTYTITLKVTDNDGSSITSTSKTVIVPSNLPVANFKSTVNWLVVAFDASSSVSVLGLIKVYSWDLGNGVTKVSASPKLTYTYTEPKEYTVKLTITDSNGLTAIK